MSENPIGRPTKYKPEYCQDIVAFFDIEPYNEVIEITTYKDGTTKENKKFIACDLPTFEGFCKKIKIHIDSLYEWQKIYKDFSVSMRQCRALQKSILITNSLKGLYQSNYAIFVTSNLTKFRQKKDITGNIKKSITHDTHALDELIKKIDKIDEFKLQSDIKDKQPID
jgi:hypothetical protein